MKIVIDALSARFGGGQTYIANILAYLPDSMDAEVLIFAPSTLILREDPRIIRGKVLWPTDNPILRALWQILYLPVILRREKAQLFFCPGGVTETFVPGGCKTVTTFQNMMPFDSRLVASLASRLQRIRNYILKPLMLRCMRRADLTIFISNYARSVIERQIEVRNAITLPHGIGSDFRTFGRTLLVPPGCRMGIICFMSLVSTPISINWKWFLHLLHFQ